MHVGNCVKRSKHSKVLSGQIYRQDQERYLPAIAGGKSYPASIGLNNKI